MTASRSGTERGALGTAVPLAQCLLGAALLSWPAPISRALAGHRASAPPRWVARLLGGRLLAQGGATLALPGPVTAWASVTVDATHAASMLLLAAVSSRYRRPALVSAAVAGAFAAASSSTVIASHGRSR